MTSRDTLEMANDYVNSSWEEFEEKYKDKVRPEVMEYLGSHLGAQGALEGRAHQPGRKGAPQRRPDRRVL